MDINQISYIEDALSTAYVYRLSQEGKIESLLVANVVKTGETTRELKISNVNFVGAVEPQDIIDDNLEGLVVAIDSETALTF